MTLEKRDIEGLAIDSHEIGELYALRGAAFMRVLLKLYGRWWIWVYAAVASVGVLLAILIDFRLLLVSAFVMLILAPATMMFLYFYHGLKRGCFSNYVLHTIEAKEDGVELKLYARNKKVGEQDVADKSDADKPDADKLAAEGQEPDEVLEHTGTVVVRYDWLSRYFIAGNGIVFPFGGEEDGFLWLPAPLCTVTDTYPPTEPSGVLDIILQRPRAKEEQNRELKP